MACPRCSGLFETHAESCPRCQFSLATARQAFPFTPPPLDFFINPAQLLPPETESALFPAYEALRSKFPQVRVTLGFLTLAPQTRLSEFAFWWFNDAPGGNDERHWHLLLVYDAHSGGLSLTPGYALEPYLLSSAWETALEKTAAAAATLGWPHALHGFLQLATALLEADWCHTTDQPSPPPPSES